MESSVVIITGGAQRIGLAFARSLIASKAKVLVTYRSHKPEIEALKKQSVDCYQVDLTIEDERNAFIDYVLTHYKNISAIVHNASSWLPEKPTNSHTKTLGVNFGIHVDVPYILNLAFSDKLQAYAQHTGKMADIIHMTDYVVEKGSKKHIAYAASKAALANMTLSFASALAPLIKVNNIAPALLMFNDHDSDEYKKKASKKSLLPAAPGPQEAVDTLHCILNSQYVTGRTFALDGGRQLKS